MPSGLGLPETVVFTLMHKPETVLRDLANQILRQGLVVGNLKETLGTFMFFQFLAKWLQPLRAWAEVKVCFVRGESEQESGLYEEGGSPFDCLLGLRCDALKDLVQLA